MQLYTPDQLSGAIQGRVCRHSRWMALVGAILICAFLVGMPVWFVCQARPSLWISFPVLSLASLLTMWLLGLVAKAFRSTNWLMRIAPDGLWINLRSYLNHEFSPAATVLFLPYAEIASVGSSAVKRSERSSDGTTAWTDRYLDIQLVDPAPAEVAAEISAERQRVLPGEHLGGFVTSRSRNNHVPVTMPNDRLLRLAWRGRYDFVVPSLKKTLCELAAKCAIDEPSTKDVADVKLLTDEEVDGLIIECVETGDTFGAVKLLRERRGMSLKNAKQFVDEMVVRL